MQFQLSCAFVKVNSEFLNDDEWKFMLILLNNDKRQTLISGEEWQLFVINVYERMSQALYKNCRCITKLLVGASASELRTRQTN